MPCCFERATTATATATETATAAAAAVVVVVVHMQSVSITYGDAKADPHTVSTLSLFGTVSSGIFGYVRGLLSCMS